MLTLQEQTQKSSKLKESLFANKYRLPFTFMKPTNFLYKQLQEMYVLGGLQIGRHPI